MSLFLDEDELYELTGYRQRAKQKAALAELCIAFRVRPADGYPLVHREAAKPQTKERKTHPDFEALDKAS